jgi:IS30 family transposase
MAVVFTQDEVKTIRRLRAAGLTLMEVGRQVGTNHVSVRRICLVPDVLARARFEWQPRKGRLTISDREEILLGLQAGASFAAIARALGRSTSTVSREVKANGGPAEYSAWQAHRRAQQEARRPKEFKLTEGLLLRKVTEWLWKLWSPQEIAGRLRSDFPDRPEMWVSHETIYQSLFVQGRGELRRELARCLRSGRTQRRPHGSKSTTRGKIPNMVMLSERPAEADDRNVPGHWEGDLILGKNGASAVGTLVERTTRFVLLLHLDGDRTAENVQLCMQRAIATLPEALKRSIAWDQGSEMSQHAAFTIATGIPIYFCDPHSPWMRGSNENTNGLLRQYMPKGTDLSLITPEQLQEFQDSLNGRPRQTLGWRSPAEELTRLVALAA